MQPNNSQITHQSIFYYYYVWGWNKRLSLLSSTCSEWDEMTGTGQRWKVRPLSKWFQGLSHSVFDLWPKYATFVCSHACICAYDPRCLVYLWSVLSKQRKWTTLLDVCFTKRKTFHFGSNTPTQPFLSANYIHGVRLGCTGVYWQSVWSCCW